jgi:hypothetical protein
LVFGGLRRRYDLLDIDQDPIRKVVGLQAHAADVEIALVQAKDGGRQFQ